MTLDRPVRTRYAPSPTGNLHIGGVRTALYSWLYARHFNGQFLLRIEDTDLERSEERFTQDIYTSMKWLGLSWDEEPLYQSKRMDLYLAKAKELIERGHAYWCTCTEGDVEKMREVQIAKGLKPMYDRRCRDKKLPQPKLGENGVVRLKVPLDGHTEFEDLIRGPIRVENVEVDDFVLIRSNGAPTYNMSCVVDDVAQGMSHVIRGDDHINNTPKQIHLYEFFGYEQPRFAHLPMVLGPDKKKLSKRNGEVSTNSYRAEGFLPEAMLNFLARLGWSHGDQEVFSLQELTQFFGFDHVQKASGVFNPEKLLWLGGEHIRRTTPERLADIVVEDFGSRFQPPTRLDRVKSPIGLQLIALLQPKVKRVQELAEQLIPLLTPGPVTVDASSLKWIKDASLKSATQAAVSQALIEFRKRLEGAKASPSRLGADSVWGSSPSLGDAGMSHADIDASLRQLGEQHGIKLGDLVQPMRLCVLGQSAGASVFELLAILPWDLVEPRLKQVLSL